MATIDAAPTSRVISRDSDGNTTWAHDLQTAISRAEPGDVILLHPGHYTRPVIVATWGEDGMPITIRGVDRDRVILDGGCHRDDGRHGGMDPLDGDFAFIKLLHARNLVFENLSFINCWPCAFYMRSVRNVTIRDCTGRGARFFVYARQLDRAPTRNLLIERVDWVQDVNHDMWDGRVTWREVKAKPKEYDASYFNGAMFGSFDIEGGVTIRDCDIAHAFNTIRMDIRDTRVTETDGVPEIARNRDVFIYRNRFAFIRDNAVEPEMGAQNWYVFNNRFFNVHATFSLDGVAARDVFIVANWVLNNRRPGLPGQRNQGGKVFKMLGLPKDTGNMRPRPRKGLWSLFNSAQTRTSYSKEGRTTEWNEGYTLLGLYGPKHPEEPCAPRAAFMDMEWHERIQVFGMLTNDPRFPQQYLKEGAEVDGQGDLGEVFALEDFRINPCLPLGGWTGELDPHPDLPETCSEELVIERAKGEPLMFPAGLAPGARPIAEYGIAGWPV